ncbi:lysozyme [Thiocystis violascens]|uniref:Lysozyme n=1 Tax=Thiocystis violascens (strain ATCC 17096 / DSM 198 / 6111) TaxID=765911 RepID=I3YEG4_THIV6|nr:lysozyme [Thiocystis violascens]AFL75382.1 phage-related lysozyme (muraminidase) [Thiocystis violascens DSM 198]
MPDASDAPARHVNAAGLALIQRHEGLTLRAYRCPAGVWTIGYGSTRDVTPGLVIDLAEADRRLRQDLRAAERAVAAAVRVPLNDNEFSALVSFVYNVGAAAFADSTLLRRLNGGQRADAARQFARWNRGGGRVLPGLITRRAAEVALFRAPVTPPSPPSP